MVNAVTTPLVSTAVAVAWTPLAGGAIVTVGTSE